MKRTRRSVISISAGFLMAGVMAFATTYGTTKTPRSLSDWHDSADGKLSVCLAVNQTTFSQSENLVIRCAVRNNTDKPILILRPFGDRFYAVTGGVHLLGPDGELKYDGPMIEYELGIHSFHELMPGMVIDETLEIPQKRFKGMGAPGLYRVEYRYLSSGYPESPAPDNLWKGKIDSGAVNMLVVDK